VRKNMIKVNLNYFYSTISDGTMSMNPKFYKEGMTSEEMKQDFTKRRIAFGETRGFDGLKIVTQSQKSKPLLEGATKKEEQILLDKYNSKYPDGHYVKITEEMIEGIEDLHDLKIDADILMMDSLLPKTALAYPVNDFPVVFVEDTKNKVVAMAYCGGEYIDRFLPSQMIDAIREETDAKLRDISVYIGPHAKKESFVFCGIPKWVQNFSAWSEAITNQYGYFYVDMNNAITNQLLNQGIEACNIVVSSIDTVTDPKFYSYHEFLSHKKEVGKFYTGCYYEKVKVESKNKGKHKNKHKVKTIYK